jgi:hypothetical protein
MAEIIRANCRICGYSIRFKFGGSKFDYLTNCPVPAYNKETQILENINYFSEKNNPSYIFYFQNELKGDNPNKIIFQNFDLKLNQANNFCTVCKNFCLDFFSQILC